ncbi:arylesterase, partial [Pseudoalteromonas undina]
DALLAQYHPSHVLIELGANDGLRGFPVTNMQANLTDLIEKRQAENAMVALMEIYIHPNNAQRNSKMFTDRFTQL